MKELFDFQIGDRVEVVRVISNDGATRCHVGHCGTVATFSNSGFVGVAFDEKITESDGYTYGHSCYGCVSNDQGWYCYPSELELLKPDIICSVEDLL